MISATLPSEYDPTRRDAAPKHDVTWRRGALATGVVGVGLTWFVANFAGLIGLFLEVPLNEVQNALGDVALYAPLATTGGALAAALSPSRRWSLWLGASALIGAAVWVLAVGLLGATL